MSEYDHLITTICSSTASVDARSSAERRLLELLSMPSNLAQCLPSLYTANDTIVFFLGIGLQRLIWKYWTHMDQSQQDSLLQTIKETLVNRLDLQPFSKAKLEQVLAAICVASSSLQPVFSIICQVDNPGFLTGLSAVKTVLENVLGDDPKVDSISREGFVAESGPILSPLTNLACTACLSAMQQSQSESSLRSMKIGLDLLKVIVSKLQIGPHITLDVLMLLFSIAEAYPDPSSPFHELAFSAVEILTEVMYKRYIPTGSTPSSSSSSSSASSSSSSSSSGGTKSDQGVKVLMHLVAKTIDLLKRYRENLRNPEDSQMVTSLLEFIAVFGENHMERCMNAAFSHVHITSMDEDVARLQETTMTFFNELVVLTTSSMDPRLLLKTVQVWRRLVTIAHVKESILSQQSVCVTIVSHLLSACLIQSNPHLQENMDEILDSLHADVYVDTHSKEIMGKVSPLLLPQAHGSTAASTTALGSNRAHISSAEEHNYVGCALQEEVHELLPEFLDSKFACQWLHATLPTLLTNNMTVVLSEPCPSLSYTRASLDLRVLIRMVPLIATSLEPILQLLTFVVQVVERHVDRGTLHKECVLLLMTGTQIVGQFFLGHRFSREIETTVKSVNGYGGATGGGGGGGGGVGQVSEETAGSDHPSPQEWAQHMETTFGALSRVLQALFSGAYTSLRVNMELQSLLTSLVILYAQSVQALVPLLDLDMFKRWRDMVDENLSMFLSPGNAMQIQTQCPIVYEDIAALFLCAKEAIQPGGMSAVLVPQLGEATHMLESVAQQLQQPSSQQQQQSSSTSSSSSSSTSSVSRVLPLLHPQTLDAVYHVVASLDILTRNHHSMKATKRQVIATTLTPMGALLPRFVHSLLYLQQIVWMEFYRFKQASLHATTSNNRSRSTSQDATLVITPGGNGGGGVANGGNGGGVGVGVGVGGVGGVGGGGDASAEIALVMEKLTKITKLAIALTTALLQRVGKKTFGKVSGDVFELCVAFTETCTTPTPTAPEFVTSSMVLQPNYLPQPIQAIYALNPQNILALALFDPGHHATSSCQGLKVLLEIFELSQLVAQSTAATSSNVATQIQCTHRLLLAILPYLSDDRVCAELLPMTLKTGIAAVNNYWQKAPRTSGGLPFLPSIAAQSAHGGGPGFSLPPHPLLQASPSSLLPRHPLSDTNGVDASGHGLNVKALTGVFVTLCIGSLGDAVPPSDTLIALEGLLSLKEQHDVFNVSWFQEEWWEGLFGRVVRCLLLRIHAMHGGELEALFTWLVDTRVHYLRAVSASASVSRTSPHSMLYAGANSPSLLANGASAGSPVVVVGNDGAVRTQEFWFQLGNQMVTLASEVDCGDLVHEYLSPVIATFIATSTGGNGGDVSADALRHLGHEVVQRMVRPVVALIFRRI